ncbi:MAG: CHASE2 domain-containing protein [Geminicoccaceae bacterium]
MFGSSAASARPEPTRTLAGRLDLPTSLIGSLIVLLLVALHGLNPPIVEAVRLKIFDELQALYPRLPRSPIPVTIVDIDDASLAAIGQWPWPRSVFAELFGRLGEMGASVVVCDILFAERDRYSPPVYADSLAARDPGLAAQLRTLPDNDALMASAMAERLVVLGVSGIAEAMDGGERKPLPTPIVAMGNDPRAFLPEMRGLVGVTPTLSAAAAGLGLVTLVPDVDGIVRRVPLIGSVNGQLLPSLALEAARIAFRVDKLFVRSGPNGINSIAIGRAAIPVDTQGRAWVSYGLPDPAQYVSAAQVIDGTVPADRFKGHIVFVGASAAGLGDIKPVPIVGAMPGVEIQASLLHTLISGQVLRRPASVEQLENVGLLVLGLTLAWAGPFLRAGYLPALLGLAVAAGLGGTWYAFRFHQLLLDGVYVAAALAVLLFWLAMARYVREEARRRTIRNAFSRYLSPVMVDRLTSSASALNLGGERRELTVLFADIRGFTTLSERYERDPEGLTALLTRYFTAMSATIQKQSGTIDKYIGDAIMAFWNAPLPVERHPRAACLAALQMRAGLAELNEALAAEAGARGEEFKPLRIGIGLNTGFCFVGNMGSEQRFNYTVIGDPVNVASRIEGRCKSYGFDLVIGESTREGAPDLAVLEIDRVRLMGKTTATRLFALLGDEQVAASERFEELAEEHAAMVVLYRARDWDGAMQKLRRCHHLGQAYRLDDFYELFGLRIALYMTEPPPPDWDGSHVAEDKH